MADPGAVAAVSTERPAAGSDDPAHGRAPAARPGPADSRGALRAFFSDRHGRVVIAQRPNAPLIAFVLLGLPALYVGDPHWAALLRFFSNAALVTWC